MKPLSLSELSDTPALSQALHQVLLALHCSALRISAVQICRLLNLHPSDLARMRWAHQRPRYVALVNKLIMRRVLAYLLDQFPTLVIGYSAQGEIIAHLYKYYRGKRLRRSMRRVRAPAQPLRRPCRPGSTRWFMQHDALLQTG